MLVRVTGHALFFLNLSQFVKFNLQIQSGRKKRKACPTGKKNFGRPLPTFSLKSGGTRQEFNEPKGQLQGRDVVFFS